MIKTLKTKLGRFAIKIAIKSRSKDDQISSLTAASNKELSDQIKYLLDENKKLKNQLKDKEEKIDQKINTNY